MSGPVDPEPSSSSETQASRKMASQEPKAPKAPAPILTSAPDASASANAHPESDAKLPTPVLSTGTSPLKLSVTARSQGLSPIADASPATSMIELADDPPSHPPTSPPQPMAVPATMQQPTPVSPSSAVGSPLSASHLHSLSPHSPSSPGFAKSAAASSSGSSRARARPTSALVASAIGISIPPKPRSNSSLTTNRPAPPSPASSRPQSQVLDLSPRGSPIVHGMAGPTSPPAIARSSPSPVGRERATSTSSAVSQGRRIRPRSTLGTNVTSARETAQTSTSDPSTPSSQPAGISFMRRGGSFDARSGGFGGAVAEEALKDEDAEESMSVEPSEAPTPPPAALTTATVASAKADTLAQLAATIVRRVIVRDFAFSMEDERFLGLGSQRPRSNWCEGEPEPEAPTKPASEGFGFPLGLGSWGFLRGNTDADEPETEGRVEDLGNEHDADAYWSDTDEFDDDEYFLDDEEPDGLYRAAYAFEPEGVNEMAVDVGDLLDVRGRGGGGDGWVVATRLDTGAEGLVPEGYLERAAESEYPTQWAQVRVVREQIANDSRELSASPDSTGETEDDDDDRERALRGGRALKREEEVKKVEAEAAYTSTSVAGAHQVKGQ